jgi:transcriptional regulator
LRDGSVDAGLFLLLAVTPRGVTWTQEEIATACGCSIQNIQYLERRAMEKIRRAVSRQQFRVLEDYL